MEIDEAIRHRQTFDEIRKQVVRVSLSFYPANMDPAIPSFEEAGRTVRICKEFIGKPAQNYVITSGKYRLVEYRGNRTKKVEAAKAKLLLAGITEFRAYPPNQGWSDLLLTFFVPTDCYITSFYKSNDPVEWKKINDHKVRGRRIIKVERALDGK